MRNLACVFIVFFSLTNTFSQISLDCKGDVLNKYEGIIDHQDTNYIFFKSDKASRSLIGLKGELYRSNEMKLGKGNMSWLKLLAEIKIEDVDGNMLKLSVLEDGEPTTILALLPILLKIDLKSALELHTINYFDCISEETDQLDGATYLSKGCKCENKKKGEWLTYRNNGTLYKVENYNKEGKLGGRTVYFYPGGDTLLRGEYTANKKSGEWLEYYEGGKRKKREQFNLYGLKVGEQIDYYPDGLKKMTIVYPENYDGEIVYTFNYESGAPKENYSLNSRGDTTGRYTRFFEYGILAYSVDYEFGLKSGKEVDCYPSGKLKSMGNYNSGEKTGKWLMYFENGDQKSISHYFGGKLNGEMITYFENGATSITAKYNNGQLTEKYIEFHENGQVKEVGFYGLGDQIGMRIGKWVSYYSDGNKSASGSYENGGKKGKWIEWDTNGVKRRVNY